MSLGIIIKATEGLVLAAESRVTLMAKIKNAEGKEENLPVSFDNATKLFTFNGKNSHIGAVTYGLAIIGLRTAHSFLPEFETKLEDKRYTVEEHSNALSDFFMQQWTAAKLPEAKDYKGPNMTFNVAGYDDNEPYGKIFKFDIPRAPKAVEQNPGPTNFGIAWGGQREIVDRLLMGYDTKIFEILVKNNYIKQDQIKTVAELLKPLQLSLPIPFMPLQDCVNLAILFIRTTIDAQHLTVGLRGCGGNIDVAIITRNNPLQFIDRKEITS